MIMFTDCSGECKDCAIGYTSGCIAGHGDDDFVRLTEKDIPHILRYGNDNDINRLLRNHPEYGRTIKLYKLKNL